MRYPNGLHVVCGRQAADHYDDHGMYRGCPRRSAAEIEADHNAALSNRLDALLRGLVVAYGPAGAQQMLDYLDVCGDGELRRRLALLSA